MPMVVAPTSTFLVDLFFARTATCLLMPQFPPRHPSPSKIAPLCGVWLQRNGEPEALQSLYKMSFEPFGVESVEVVARPALGTDSSCSGGDSRSPADCGPR